MEAAVSSPPRAGGDTRASIRFGKDAV